MDFLYLFHQTVWLHNSVTKHSGRPASERLPADEESVMAEKTRSEGCWGAVISTESKEVLSQTLQASGIQCHGAGVQRPKGNKEIPNSKACSTWAWFSG